MRADGQWAWRSGCAVPSAHWPIKKRAIFFIRRSPLHWRAVRLAARRSRDASGGSARMRRLRVDAGPPTGAQGEYRVDLLAKLRPLLGFGGQQFDQAAGLLGGVADGLAV